MIQKYYNEVQSTTLTLEHELKWDKLMNQITWNKNTKPNAVWSAIQQVNLAYAATCPLTLADKIKWVTRNSPNKYQNTIKDAKFKMQMKHKDWSYKMTFKDLTAEINLQYKIFNVDAKNG